MNWWIFALALLAFEIATGAFYMLALAVCAALAGAMGMAFPEGGASLQVIVFALSGAGSCAGMSWLRADGRMESPCILNSMVGRRFTLPMDAVSGSSRIPLSDGEWPVQLREDLPAGTEVEVTDRDGIRLILSKVK